LFLSFFRFFFFSFVSVFLVEFASGVSSRVCDCLSEVPFVSCVGSSDAVVCAGGFDGRDRGAFASGSD
jgi:hypothetical protein